MDSGVYVGCDSLARGRNGFSFITVVVLHYECKHGAKIVYRNRTFEPQFMSIQERLWKEVELAGELATNIAPVVGERPFSVHLDLNRDEEHKSSTITQAAIWYIRNLGFEAVVKPHAHAASYAADHMVRCKS